MAGLRESNGVSFRFVGVSLGAAVPVAHCGTLFAECFTPRRRRIGHYFVPFLGGRAGRGRTFRRRPARAGEHGPGSTGREGPAAPPLGVASVLVLSTRSNSGRAVTAPQDIGK